MFSLLLVAHLSLLAPSIQGAQNSVVLDRMLAIVNGEVVTMSDVRAGRQLKLIAGADAMSDEQLLDALIERRLTVAEVGRYTAAQPASLDVEARQRAWESSLPRGVTAAAALASVGMRAAALIAWFRDDLRLAAYLDQRFTAAAQPTRQQALAYFEQHAADFAVNGATPEFASVEPEVRRRVATERRAARIKDWVESLKQRAEIRRLGK